MPPEKLVLWGDDFPTLGEVGVAEIAGRVAIALSRGRMPKPYGHVDPNEDAVIALAEQDRVLLAVADGHRGFEAACSAVASLTVRGPRLVTTPPADPIQAVRGLFENAAAAVAEAVAVAQGERRSSRTALSVAYLAGVDLYAATLGDTVVVRVRNAGAKPVTQPAPFLGPRSSAPPVTHVRLRPTDRVVVASDGLTDYLGRHWPRRVGELAGDAAPERAVERLVEAAFLGGAGDNVAIGCAVVGAPA